MKKKVELVFHTGCKNKSTVRERLSEALKETGEPPEWTEWNTADPDCPDRLKNLPSPTVLIDGETIEKTSGNLKGDSCRIRDLPDVDTIVDAIKSYKAEGQNSGWISALGAVPAAVLAIVPIGLCPACLPAYLGVLSALGLGFLNQWKYLFPLTLGALAIFLGVLIYEGLKKRRFAAVLIGTAGSALLIAGKFVFESDPANYAGIALVLTAAIWNAFISKESESSCPACAEDES